tara:strand:+ start:1554 stop:1775 length:222 start_codon:yes stop_codon:yes gene_type:complete
MGVLKMEKFFVHRINYEHETINMTSVREKGGYRTLNHNTVVRLLNRQHCENQKLKEQVKSLQNAIEHYMLEGV